MIDEVLSLATAAQSELGMKCAGNICQSHGEKMAIVILKNSTLHSLDNFSLHISCIFGLKFNFKYDTDENKLAIENV